MKNIKVSKHILSVLLLLSNITATIAAPSSKIAPAELGCELRVNPLGIDVLHPDFNYIVKAISNSERGLSQTAYQIIVASSQAFIEKNIGDMWNSGQVLSNKNSYMSYAGKPLQSSHKYYWKVKVWDNNKRASNWSSAASFTTGIYKQDLHAKWIAAPWTSQPNKESFIARKEFEVKSNLVRAVVHISGLGQYELSLNGNKVGDELLAPGWTNYEKTILYNTFDITQQLKAGKNAVGIVLGNGMYNIKKDAVRYVKFINSFGALKAIAQIKLEYKDGSTQIIITDETWKASKGPITFNNIFAGEDYDANLFQDGWDKPGFVTDTSWKSVAVTEGPGGVLKGLSCSAPPIKAIETIMAVKATEVKPGLWIYDFGQNASMMPRIKVSGVKGSYIRMIPTELLGKDGLADRASATQDGVRPAWWQYTLSGKGSEEWFPKFFYQGARYLQVELYAANKGGTLPNVELLQDVIVHSSATPVGTFETSNDLFNRIYNLVRWAQRSNMMSLMTDCPQREKLGWLEENHLNGPSLRYNFNMAPLFRKSVNDMADAQLDTGFVPNIAPEYFIASTKKLTDGFRNSPEWGSSFIIVPWQQYVFSGDVSLLKNYYYNMKRYVAFLASSAKNNILTAGLGDWYDLGPKAPWGSQLTPVPYTATAIYYYDNWIMSRIAKLLGYEADANAYGKAAGEIRDAFNKEFYKPETGQYATGSQTCNAMALYLNLAAPEHRRQLTDAIVADIRKRGNGLTSGDVGYRFLLKALAEEGRSDVIFDMNNQSEKPGYGYQLKMGATSLTEKWDASVGNFGSQNHFMLGQINEWFFNDVIGISSDENGAGFKKIIIKPAVLDKMDWVKGSFNSINGKIISEYKKENRNFLMKVSIPANTTATVYIPATNNKNVIESGKPASSAKGIKFMRVEDGRAVYEVGSGNYVFASTL